jgi:hypothetical protein
MKLKVHWHQNAYAIADVDVDDPEGKLIVRDNMWEHGWVRAREDFGGDADAYVLDLHKDVIKEYFDTGMTFSDWGTLERDKTLTVPARRISAEDVAKYYTISVHLGKGREGARRAHALKILAAEAGHYWNGEPSIGRWLSSVADEKLGPDWVPKAKPSTDLKAKIVDLAQEQLEMWQALLKELA